MPTSIVEDIRAYKVELHAQADWQALPAVLEQTGFTDKAQIARGLPEITAEDIGRRNATPGVLPLVKPLYKTLFATRFGIKGGHRCPLRHEELQQGILGEDFPWAATKAFSRHEPDFGPISVYTWG